ncbi:DNA cytosine methyltransferase [Streptomyces europaeiscabiei]|uniref:hypothetical protein n=1 Tax=Streptomyces europaeiscabiei TaxID=146819 RepID=UPI0029B21E37|nr:hypothetical protein [Streptomyces europaeiscabiei]MDX3694701.1 DNA cytosine methyltransferase [Streptomyces europaeiscabiei]
MSSAKTPNGTPSSTVAAAVVADVERARVEAEALRAFASDPAVLMCRHAAQAAAEHAEANPQDADAQEVAYAADERIGQCAMALSAGDTAAALEFSRRARNEHAVVPAAGGSQIRENATPPATPRFSDPGRATSGSSSSTKAPMSKDPYIDDALRTAAARQGATSTVNPDSTGVGEQTDDPYVRREAVGPEHGDALAPAERETAAESCPACQRKEVRAGLCSGCDAAIGAEAAAAALAGMPRNAGVLVREAAELGWDVRAERRWTGRLWVRALVISGLVMVRAGVEETEHVCAWNEATGKLVASASTGGFKAVREAIKAVRVVSREQEATGRTVWGRDAAEWVRQMDGAVAKVSAALCDARDAFNALDGSTPTGARAVELASAAYAEARAAERSAVDAVKAARAWLAETNGDDARGCASWRSVVVLAGQHVKEAGEAIADAVARAEREALAAPIIEEAQERLNDQEAGWRKRLAESGREPSARGYAGLIVMFEDSSRDWCAWFDGYTDRDSVKHAGHGDPSRSFVAQYDAWGKSKHSDRSVHFPSRYTSASLIAGGRVDAAALAFTLAVVGRIEGHVAETLRKAAAAVRKNPQGFGTANDRKRLADWSKYPHNSYGEPTRLAEHAPAEWAALEAAQAAYNGVRDFHNALYWDAYYAGERANARAVADRAGLDGRDAARAERAESGRAASEWAAAVERLTTARARVNAAVVLAAGDVERAQACSDRVREGDALAEEVWSAVRFCEEAYDDVNRAKRDAAHYAESAEIYREAGALSDYVAECARMEDAAARAESGREETLNLYGCAVEDAAKAEEDRHAACAALPVEERPAAVAAEVTDFKPWGAGLRLVCACGAVHAPTVPVVDGDGAHVGALVNANDWMINGMLQAAGLRAAVGRDQWSRGVLLSSVDGAEACLGWRIPVEAAPVVSHCQGCGLTVADGSEWHATCKPVEPAPAAAVAADLSSLWAREAVDARTAAIELAPRGVRQPKGSPVTRGGRKGEWECGGRVYAIDRKPKDPAGTRQELPPNTVYDMTPVRDGSAVSAPIIGHAHGAADGRKVIRHYAREVAVVLAKQATAAEESAEVARVAECERITSLSGRELAEEQRERAAVMVAEVADASGASGDLARGTAAAEAAVSRCTGGDAGQQEAVAGDDVAAAQLSAALKDGESIAAVSFVDGREPAAGWVLTTAAGHAFRIRPVTSCRPEEGQWEAGHDADGSYWWSANVEDRPLTKVLARIREDSATRTRFAALWAKYGQYTEQAPAFECSPDRKKLERGVFLVRRFGAVGLVAECRWGFEHLTDADGRQGRTGEDWARKGPDNRRYVAEWKVWSLALEGVANSRLRVVSVCADDDTAADADAYCAMSAPYVGKCSAKRSGARYWVSVVTDQGCELGRFVACARCLSGRILDDAQGGGRFSGRDVVALARDLAKGDPKTCALYWQHWGDRAAELCGQLLTEALENGERAPWPSKALADALIAQGAVDGDDRAKREARAAVRERGGDKRAQDGAAALAVDMRVDRAALVASVRASRAAFYARLDAECAAKDAECSAEAGDHQAAEEYAGRASDHASAAVEAAAVADAAGYGPAAADAAEEAERANEAARKAVAALAGLAGSGVADSDAVAAAGAFAVDVDALTVTPHERNGEPSTYEFTVTGPGLVVGEYEIAHDCQGKGARGVMWRASWRGTDEAGRWDVITLGKGEGRAAALALVAEHAEQSGGILAEAFEAARGMYYRSGEWILPDVGPGEAITYREDRSWHLRAATGHAYTVRREWEGRTASGDLAPLQVWAEDGDGGPVLVASCTAVDDCMSAWAPMLERLRSHAAAVADGVAHRTVTTPGGPGRDWAESWCVCGWVETVSSDDSAERGELAAAAALAHRRRHYPQTSAAAAKRAAQHHAEQSAERDDVVAALVSAAVATPAGLAGSGGEGSEATPEAEESRPVRVPDTFAASGRTPLTYDDLDGWTYADFVAAHPSEEDAADLVKLAGPGPVRWLFAPAEGDAPRAVNLFGGCGGWCVGIRRILGATVDMLCIDASRDATATATRAGCHAICADVRSIDPEHFVFRYTQILIGSSPCIDFTNAGKRAGRLPENVAALADAIEQAGAAVGNYIVDGPGCTCLTDEECECGPEAYDHFGPRSGATWDEIRSLVADLPGAETAGLMLEPMIWALALKHGGAPLHTILFEQSNQLPEEIRDVIKNELYCAGESELGAAVSVTWEEIDAAAYGSPSTRRRAFMMATFGRYNSGPVAPKITITADQATGLSADLEVITRGARKTSGGNAFVMGRVIPGVTSRIRSVDVGHKGGRFTLEQVAALVTLPRDYPALAEGSRTSICRQFADIVAPVVSAAVFGETVGHLFGVKRNRGGWLPLLLAYLREQYPGAEEIPAPEPPAPPEPVAKDWQGATCVGACECGRSIEGAVYGPVPACPHVEDEPEAVAAGSEAGGSGADRWLDESNARTELPRMGWCVGLADVLAAAYAGDLHADTSGVVRRREGKGRRVRAALVELLASGGYIAVPRAGRRGPVTVTPDGVTAHRWCVAAPDLLHADERAAYRARVRLHHTGRTSKQTARDRARRLTPLPYGAEEKRRRAAQMRQVEQWAKEVQATRERLESEQAERDAQAEQERKAEWARIQQEAEERQAAEEDRRDDGLVMSQHGPEEIIMGSGKRRVTVKRINPSIWHATTRGAVYVVSKEGGEDWPWLVIAPDNTRIGVCSVINDAPYAASVRDIVRDHADAMERGEPFPQWTPPEETGQGQPATTGDSDADGQTEQEPEPFGAAPENTDRTVTAAEPGACDDYACTATGPRWKVAHLQTSLLCADHAAKWGRVAVADLPSAADLPKVGEAYSTPAPARAVALDLIGSKWVAECDRHGPVSMGLNKFGDAVADVATTYVYDNEQDAADAARTHLDAHAREDADVMTPEDIDAAQALNLSRDQWRVLGWMSDGKVRETADGFTAYDISPDRADVSKKIRKNLVPRLWVAGFVKVFAVAPGVREFGLTDEGERALRMWSNAMRINAVTEPEKDTRHAAVKDSPYRWLSAGETWPGEQKKAQAVADAEQAANDRAAALRAAEEKAAAEQAATPTADELTVLEALSAEGLDAETTAVLSAAYIGHVVTRHRPGATSARIDEGTGEDERRVTRTYNVNGVEKPITPEAKDALSAIPANLTTAMAETWHALCTSVNERYGVYWLDLAAAMEAGAAALALLDQAEQGSEESAELWVSREVVQTAEPGTEAPVLPWPSKLEPK